MTELAAAVASFPVVFFDGDREIDIGTVAVHPSLEFKKFQSLISQKIGVSPHQISVSLVRRKKARSSPEIRRKVLIDESSDFSAIARERDCFVLAVLRRSRRERRARGRRGGEQKKAIDPPEKTILRRNQEGSGLDFPIGGAMREAIGLWGYDSQLRNLQRQRERYLLSTAAYYPYAVPAVGGGYGYDVRRTGLMEGLRLPPPQQAVACEECVAAKEEGRMPGFHRCVYDAVTVGFRSAVGPIERPSKKHIEASF